MPAPFLSIIIPVYNEERRIPRTSGRIFSYVEALPFAAEIIFVNDGSTDATAQMLEELQTGRQFRIVSYEKNAGKGAAVRRGVSEARGEYVVFFDIDLATPLETFDAVIPLLKEGGYPVIIGSRRVAGSTINKSESALRTFLGQGFTLLSRAFVPEVSDFTCGFKCFRADAARYIFSLARINRWAFDTEILYLARRGGFHIHQIPVQWVHDQDSRVRVFRDVLRSLQDLSLIVVYAAAGSYQTSSHEHHPLPQE